jgi:hypothetical protein
VAQAEEVLESANNERRVIRYEEFISNPARHLCELARFCGLEPPISEFLQGDLGIIDATRATGFMQSAALARFYSEVRSSRWMAHYGYDG